MENILSEERETMRWFDSIKYNAFYDACVRMWLISANDRYVKITTTTLLTEKESNKWNFINTQLCSIHFTCISGNLSN